MKKILQELVDIEKKADKIRQDAEKGSIKHINTKREVSDKLIHEKKELLSKLREEKLKETENSLKVQVESIKKEGDQKASTIANISSANEKKAVEIITKRLLTV